MPRSEASVESTVRDRAYFIWEREGRPEGQDWQHWYQAQQEAAKTEAERDSGRQLSDEEKVLAGRTDANIPAMLTKDVMGG